MSVATKPGSRVVSTASRLSVWLLSMGAVACASSNPAPSSSSSQSGATGVTGGAAGASAATSGSSGGGSAAVGGSLPSPSAGSGGNGGASSAASSGGVTAQAGSGGVAGSSVAGGSGGGGSPAVSCPASVLSSGDTNKTLQVGGASRDYVLHVPAAYQGTKPVPLIIDFHPLGGSGPAERSGSPYPAQTDAEGVIMAFPSGKQGPSGGAWNVGPCCVAQVDDVAFAKGLVSEIEKSACIDAKRVYAVGFSMGGGMSHYLACHAADVFAAVAPAAFDLLQENVDACKPSRPLSVIGFRGSSDAVAPYAGGYSAVVSGMPITFLGAKATFAKWAALDECTGAPSAEDAKGCSTYSSCKAGVQVTLCTKQGGGHEAGNASVAWPILKKYQLP